MYMNMYSRGADQTIDLGQSPSPIVRTYNFFFRVVDKLGTSIL